MLVREGFLTKNVFKKIMFVERSQYRQASGIKTSQIWISQYMRTLISDVNRQMRHQLPCALLLQTFRNPDDF